MLAISSGTSVKFAPGASLTIRGTLEANGATFTSNSATPQPGDWQGLVFTYGGAGTLTGCSVSYAQTGVEVGDYTFCDPVTPSSVVLEQCGLSHNSVAGVSGGSLSSVDVHDCTFAWNGFGLHYTGTPNHVRVEDCTFLYDNTAAIDVHAGC
jgi:hypothetical protein